MQQNHCSPIHKLMTHMNKFLLVNQNIKRIQYRQNTESNGFDEPVLLMNSQKKIFLIKSIQNNILYTVHHWQSEFILYVSKIYYNRKHWTTLKSNQTNQIFEN